MKNKLCLDKDNKRMNSFIVHLNDRTFYEINELEKNNFVEKSIIYTRKEHQALFEDKDYHFEGMVKGFFLGEDAIILSKFINPLRAKSNSQDKEKVLDIVKRDQKNFTNLTFQDNEFKLAILNEDDPIEELCDLYQRVFEYYPTDIFNPKYVRRIIKNDTIFTAVFHKGKIVSAASATMDKDYLNAEITDCVTDPGYRGKDLLAYIIIELEENLRAKNYCTLYSLTRAESVGMNLNIKRLGYTYNGTLINNCEIFSGYEDMNVWSKKLFHKFSVY